MKSGEVLKCWLIVIFLLVNSTVRYKVFADDKDSLFTVSPGTVRNICESTDNHDYETAYQVGAFKKSENAELLAKKLLSQGFYGEIRKKTVHGYDFFVVTVAKEQNPFIDRERELLDAGYSPFPVEVEY
ncbi:MAG TPA: hypothetical protein DCL73_17040 [Treponema sp.]|nr:hypothetical protein [Treponema sp.]